jgi:hypothetical protein
MLHIFHRFFGNAHPPLKYGTICRKDKHHLRKFNNIAQEAIGAMRSGVLPRRERTPKVPETGSELRCTTFTDASPPRRLHTASASCDPDDWTNVVRKEPAGPGSFG